MKKIKLLAYILFSFALFLGCKKDDVKEQEENSTFIPRILVGSSATIFPVPGTTQLLDIGDEIDFSSVQFTPAGKVSVIWKVDDVQVATGEDYIFKATTPGEHRIKVEATYEGITVNRYKDIFVFSDGQVSFTQKPYTKVVMSYLSASATFVQMNENIRWKDVTHAAFKGAAVTPGGEVSFVEATTDRKIEFFVQKAHSEGVSALLGVSGTLSLDGWSVYNSSDFGVRLRDAAKRDEIAQKVVDFVNLHHMDGVEVRMSDVGNDVEATFQGNIQAIGAFVDRLRTLFGPNKIITVSVASPTLTRATGVYSTWVVAKYLPAQFNNANWINVRAYLQSAYWGGVNVHGQPSNYELMAEGVNYWKTRVPLNKIVVGIPAIGIRHLQTTTQANGNVINNGWGNTFFNFIPYREIIAQNSANVNEDYTAAISRGVYYNGIPTITRKVQLLKTENVLGAYVWAGENDTVDDATSIIATISKTIK
ncbi:MAG: glycosyl hydrolase family 18 protein [Pedobacter sp.]|uniref:glycosyl hydrolase family 18 protein n=1 Tax=Pedobacter sp. TaxID=1411316 RepID=UPI0028093FC2|nr:glycosyl hydrolase family 18 protein [Pedobacter sp.]MDQ8003560.1 glycosyl hydrolase family 18 protein [Pedobacter sp.]